MKKIVSHNKKQGVFSSFNFRPIKSEKDAIYIIYKHDFE